MSSLISLRTIIVYTLPVITLIGLFINSLSFMIFSRKRFNKTIFSTYMRCFILIQTLNLILPINRFLELNLNLYFSRISNFCCKLRNVFSHLFLANSAWLLAVISFDRYLSVSYPNRYLFRKKVKFQVITCFCVIAFNFSTLSPTWLYYLNETNITNQSMIPSTCVSPSNWLDTLELFQLSINPFFFMILFTFLTIKNVFKSRNKINQKTNGQSTSKQNDRKFVISSIAINICFLILNFPHFFLKIIKEYTKLFNNSKDLLALLQAIFLFLLYINLISTFLVQYLVNSIFKSEFEIFLFRNRISLKKQNKR
jgi:hypothetical protein